MKHYIVGSLFAAMILGAGLSRAADTPPGGAAEAKPAVSPAKAPAKNAKKQAAPKQKQVDINKASKQELMTLPFVDEATADKIIAGRPYLTKANLVSHKIMGLGPYQSISKRIYASQESATPMPKK